MTDVQGLPAEDATDAFGNPLLVAVDRNDMFTFSVDAEKQTVHADTQDVSLLNMIASWLRMLPVQAPFPPPPHIIQQQMSEAVKRAKDQGNAAYRQKDYKTAVKHYTMGLAIASSRPMWESSGVVAEELSIMLANRSAAFLAAEAYIEALCDADAVVKIKNDWGKGHFRKGKALAALHRYDEARAAFDLGHQFEPDNEDFVKAIAELP
ncbi:Hsp90 binding protein [Malassezia pachydermatis]|uniref:Translocation protein sec72 n=1 Tax=Malassezia pachydermatis TaxID=77020 RepID=A0A0M9VP09_9BASI|nr:translocation protein sec72 [Malassezia pachydermatis]KOS13923.1 translocation protein sec72 [Malassezia pachydermatis]